MKRGNKQFSLQSVLCIVILFALPLFLTGCGKNGNNASVSTTESVSGSGSVGGDTAAGPGTPVPGDPGDASGLCSAAEGKLLYGGQGNCDTCHGPFESTTVPKGTTVGDIERAIIANGSMKNDPGVASLTDDQKADIAWAMGDVNNCEKPRTETGSGPGSTAQQKNGLLDSGLTGTAAGIGSALGSSSGPLGGLFGAIDNTLSETLISLDLGGITAPTIIAPAGNLLNATAYPVLNPLLNNLMFTSQSLQSTLIPVSGSLGFVSNLVNNTVLGSVEGAVATVNQAVGGTVVALIPMPLDPGKSCEECHHSKVALIAAMTNPAYNLRYPGLAADVPFVDNFYVDPKYTTLPDSMMSKAAKHPKWEGCQTCHGSGSEFNPFPSDNWVPNANSNEGPEVAKGWATTNDASKTCGKCHVGESNDFNKGMMGTHRGHLFAFNYNDIETEATNDKSNFYYSPFGPIQGGTDLNTMPLDRNGKPVHTGYYQSRASCSVCHQSCSDCHMTGPGNSPIGTLGFADITKGAAVELIRVDQTHTSAAVRVKANAATSIRRGGVFLLELRKGYIPGVFRGIPYTVYETGMDVATHKIIKPTTAEQGNTMAPQTQMQSIEFCWRCHFRTGAEYTGNYVGIVPNVNYSRKSLGHLQAGMTCTDCHNAAETMGATSKDSLSFAGTSDAPDNPSHPGGNPVGSTGKWENTPHPVKVTCGLCHTAEGKASGPTGGSKWGKLVTPRYQKIAKPVKGLDYLPVPGKTSAMSHKNIKCEACHTQAQQNCWNCHIERAEEVTGLPFIGTNDVSLNLLPTSVNVREAEGIPALEDWENALLMEVPSRNDSYAISLALTFPDSPNTVNKSVRFLARNNQDQVGSVVHCPGPTTGTRNPNKEPQPLNLDGGQVITKQGAYGEEGSVQDVTTWAEGTWFMEPGHSIARNPDGIGFEACYNCHADTVRLGKEPVTYYRKNPWVMKGIGVPEAIMPGSHFADNRYKSKEGGFNCSCHSTTGLVHNGTADGPWPLHNLPEAEVGGDEPPTGPDGAVLYANKCASCHAPLATSTKKGATFERIKAGIAGVSMMSNLGTLTDEELHAIAKALGGE